MRGPFEKKVGRAWRRRRRRKRLIFDGLLGEEVIIHLFHARDIQCFLQHLWPILQDDSPLEIGVGFAEYIALLACATADVDKDHVVRRTTGGELGLEVWNGARERGQDTELSLKKLVDMQEVRRPRFQPRVQIRVGVFAELEGAALGVGGERGVETGVWTEAVVVPCEQGRSANRSVAGEAVVSEKQTGGDAIHVRDAV